MIQYDANATRRDIPSRSKYWTGHGHGTNRGVSEFAVETFPRISPIRRLNAEIAIDETEIAIDETEADGASTLSHNASD